VQEAEVQDKVVVDGVRDEAQTCRPTPSPEVQDEFLHHHPEKQEHAEDAS
jgi:hypothetical protein